MDQSEEQTDALDQRPNTIVSSSSSRAIAAMHEEANATVLVPLEADENLHLPATTLSASSMALATAAIAATTGSDANANAHDAVIDLCSTSPAPSTSKSAATAAAAAVISVDSSPESSSPPLSSDDTAGGTSTMIECPICLQTCIHPARLPCGHIFCFLCVKGVAYKNRRCAMCRREIPPEFLDHPDLVNGIDDICATKSTEDGYQWFYEGRNGGWWAYDPRSSKDIEEAYQMRMLGTDTIDLEEGCQYELLICGTIYAIDFADMVQHPLEYPTRRRKICRSKHMPTKGWWQYDDRTSQDIEEAFKKGEKSCIILVAGYVYVVDLEAMVQQRQNEPSRCRRVKRDLATIPKKGVAGLRIEGNTVITDSNFASQIYQQQQQSIAVGLGALNTPTDSSSDLSLPLNYYSMRHPANASDFISTIAATDAAIRIASDIIGSTLAHADELSRGTAAVAAASAQQQLQQHAIGDAHTIAQQQHMSGENTGNYSSSYHQQMGNSAAGVSTSSSHGHGHMHGHGGSVAAAALVPHGSRELLDAAEDLLDATQNVISEADQQTIDLFEQTLNDFHALTLRNIIDSDDSDENNGVVGGGGGGGGNNGDGGGNGGDVDGRFAQRHIRF